MFRYFMVFLRQWKNQEKIEFDFFKTKKPVEIMNFTGEKIGRKIYFALNCNNHDR